MGAIKTSQADKEGDYKVGVKRTKPENKKHQSFFLSRASETVRAPRKSSGRARRFPSAEEEQEAGPALLLSKAQRAAGAPLRSPPRRRGWSWRQQQRRGQHSPRPWAPRSTAAVEDHQQQQLRRSWAAALPLRRRSPRRLRCFRLQRAPRRLGPARLRGQSPEMFFRR